jgi:uncharacterized phage protein (TIGR02218 family)
VTRAISVALKAHYASGTTTIATCWKATLTDGTVVRTTSHDSDIVFDGETYLSVAAYSPSDIVSAADLSPDNLELEGFLSSPAITEEDIQTGRWDYAEIELFEVNYNDLTMGRNLIRNGTLGELTGTRDKYKAELRGLFQKLSRRIVKVTTKDCTANLGDTRCGVNLASWTVTGAVTTATSQRQFTDTARTEANDWFTAGKLTWTSGLNIGLSMEVKRSTATGVIELHEAMPFELQVGDAYSVYAGCTSRFTEDCVGKFSNGVNFRGFPFLPLANIYKRGAR